MSAKLDQLSITDEIPEKLYGGCPAEFALRLVLLTAIVGVLMQQFNVNIGSLGQGLAYSLVGVSVFMTFRILQFPDLTVDGAFPIGGAVCAMMIVNGTTSAELTLFAAFAAGALTGLVTALITVFVRVEGLLASIIVITGAYTITLRVMEARSNVALIGERTILTPYRQTVRDWMIDNFGAEMRRHSNNVVEIIVFFVVVAAVLLLLNWFMHTELGLTIRASGKNSQVVRSLGVNHHIMVILALMISNGLAGLSGSLAVQQLGFADVSLGFGIIIRGLAAVMIGEVLLRPRTIGQHIVSAAAGMVIFDVSRAWVFSALDLPTTDIRLVSALVVLIALVAPNIHDRWKEWRGRHNQNGGALLEADDEMGGGLMLNMQNVSVIFNANTPNEVRALNGLNLNVKEGEFITVIGANGAGKSTLFNAVAGTVPISRGRIMLAGHDVTNQPEHRRSLEIGRVFQNPSLGTCPGLTIRENLSLAAMRGKQAGLRPAVKKKNAAWFHDLVKSINLGLETRLDTDVALLSGGQRQAITLIMATMMRPKLLMLDEHTAALDPNAGAQVIELTVELAQKYNLTVIMITHSMQQAVSVGDRVVMMNRGKVLFDIGGEERESLSYGDLIERFRSLKTGEELSDRALLS